MASFNQVILMGNVTRDIDLRYTPSGKAVADIGLAVNESWKDANGNEREEVLYIQAVTWGKQAENCKQYLSKGSPVLITGKLRLEQWEDKEGKKQSRIKVMADRVQFLGRRQEEGAAPAAKRETGKVHQGPENCPPPGDDEIPF